MDEKPLVQVAQKCAWCGMYLFMGQSISVYNGSDPLYTDWLCHTDCNLYEVVDYSKMKKDEKNT